MLPSRRISGCETGRELNRTQPVDRASRPSRHHCPLLEASGLQRQIEGPLQLYFTGTRAQARFRNPAAALLVASAERSRLMAFSPSSARRTSTGFQRWAFAIATTSGAWRRRCGSRSRRRSASTSSGSAGAAGTPSTGGVVLDVTLEVRAVVLGRSGLAELGPGAGALGQAVVLTGTMLAVAFAGADARVVIEDRCEVGLGKPAMHHRIPERPVDLAGIEQLRQSQYLAHLDPHLGRPGRGGLAQPHVHTLAQGEELRIGGALRLRASLQCPRWGWGK